MKVFLFDETRAVLDRAELHGLADELELRRARAELDAIENAVTELNQVLVFAELKVRMEDNYEGTANEAVFDRVNNVFHYRGVT